MWLDEIEEALDTKDRIAHKVTMQRMARVLRELADKIKEQQEVSDARACPCRLNFKLNMSDDAKELLNVAG